VTISLRDIPGALKVLREEWARQDAMEKAATPGPWEAVTARPGPAQKMQAGRAFIFEHETVSEDDMDLIADSRNLNPARLRVAKELMELATNWNEEGMSDAEWLLDFVSSLLGVEVQS
jgi:hypothetical protein